MNTKEYEVYRKATVFYFDTTYATSPEEAYNKKVDFITEDHTLSDYVEFIDHYEVIEKETGNLVGIGNPHGFHTVETLPTVELDEYLEDLLKQAGVDLISEEHSDEKDKESIMWLEGYIDALLAVKEYVQKS